MSIRLSARAAQVAPSATKAMAARAKALKAEGHDIIALTQGEPDFDTPGPICEAGLAAIKRGQTRYTPVTGVLPLREVIASRFQTDHGLNYAPDQIPDQIIVGCGAKQVIANALLATLDPGDEVIVPAPCWVTYREVVKLAGGTPVGGLIGSDVDLGLWLLERIGVAVVPGSSFLAPGHLRISYAAPTDDLKRACNRLQAASDMLMAGAA